MSLLFLEHFLSLLAQPDAPGFDIYLAQLRQMASGLNCSGDDEEGRGRANEVLSSSRQVSFYPYLLSNVWDLKEDKFNCFPFANMSR